MKRLTYISQFSRPISKEEIHEIGDISQRNNQKVNLTGALLTFGDMFYQILEGNEESLDYTYSKIINDDRHKNLVCLEIENNISSRQYPDWGMKTIDLDESNDALMQPIKSILNSMAKSHRVLEKYTQPKILEILQSGNDPTAVLPKRNNKIIFFSDLISFSSLSEKLPMQDVIEIVNVYIKIVSSGIQNNGGVVNKYIGDAVLAYFDIHEADKALESCFEILTKMKDFRESFPETNVFHYVYNGIGLSSGEVIEGNIGTENKKDYTIMGDAVNIAARIEKLTRKVNHPFLFTEDIRSHLRKDWNIQLTGKFKPKGRESEIKVFSLRDPVARNEKTGKEIAAQIKEFLSLI